MMTDITELLHADPKPCPDCGKIHRAGVKEVCVESGALQKLPYYVRKYQGTKVFLLADKNTWTVAGEKAVEILTANGIPTTPYVLNSTRAEPDEHAVGSVAMHMDTSCDFFVSVGSGVINDIGKAISNLCKLPYIIVGTAPSMDGYASATSSVIRDSLKYSLSTRCADVVIGDLDVLCQAPQRMICAGVGDLIAKYVSICEWRISALLNGEYFCEVIADQVNQALKSCVDNLDGIINREPEAIRTVMDGMVLAGMSMNFAGVSRPASGMEHYISHIFDMRGVEFNTPIDLHGIQCGIATVSALRLYEKLRKIKKPDREKALAYVKAFDLNEWNDFLREKLGSAAETMIELEEKEQKYNVELHAKRLETLIDKWDEVLAIINKLPSADAVAKMLAHIGAPTSFEEIGFTAQDEKDAIRMSKDIRYKYVGSHLLWDLGLLEEFI